MIPTFSSVAPPSLTLYSKVESHEADVLKIINLRVLENVNKYFLKQNLKLSNYNLIKYFLKFKSTRQTKQNKSVRNALVVAKHACRLNCFLAYFAFYHHYGD